MDNIKHKREGTHYRRRENVNSSSAVSLRSLVEDITGVGLDGCSCDCSCDCDFDNEYKNINRLHATCMKIINRSEEIKEEEKGDFVAVYKIIYSNKSVKRLLNKVANSYDKFDTDYSVAELEEIIKALGLLKPLQNQTEQEIKAQKLFEAKRYLQDENFDALLEELPNYLLLSMGKLHKVKNVYVRELLALVWRDSILQCINDMEQMIEAFDMTETLYTKSLSKDEFLTYVTSKEILQGEDSISIEAMENAMYFLRNKYIEARLKAVSESRK